MNDTVKLPAISAGATVRAIVPQNLDDAFRVARAISMSGMAPYGMEKPEQILVAIMHGMEIGLPPMQAVQSIAVINGRPSLWGDAAIGLVRASGLAEWITETTEGSPYEDTYKAVCSAKRLGDPEPIVRSFSVAEAKLAKLWGKVGKNGTPTPWVTHPSRMLQMRARAFCLRDGFADVLRGLGFREEMEDVARNESQRVEDKPRLSLADRLRSGAGKADDQPSPVETGTEAATEGLSENATGATADGKEGAGGSQVAPEVAAATQHGPEEAQTEFPNAGDHELLTDIASSLSFVESVDELDTVRDDYQGALSYADEDTNRKAGILFEEKQTAIAKTGRKLL